jgi:hypothetical protein
VRVICACLIAVCIPDTAIGQRLAPLSEFRVEFIGGDPWYLLAGAGATLPAGVYTRLGLNGAIGVAKTDSATRTAARIDGTVRFLLDPFRQSNFGLYGLAGVSGMFRETDGWTPRVLLGLGLEGKVRRGMASSVEVALGGGARVSLVLRRARPDRR